VWTIADIAMGRMAAVNLVAVILLGRWVLGALRDFERHAGRAEDVPPFRGSDNPDLPGDCGSEGRAPPVAPPLTGLCEHSPLTSGARRARRR
ncbi:alanine:cation symporter family protein, partial [Georgenia sp. 10Sc9-8]|nr:alanine:cation symporter family protein [Georgenia halotolerans]